MSKVLLWCPTYRLTGKLQLDPRTAECIKKLHFDGSLDVEISDYNPHRVGPRSEKLDTAVLQNVLAQYRLGREVFLDGDYDAMFTVEHDMIIPPDALQKLWDIKKDVAYGIYMLRHGRPVLNAWRYTSGSYVGMTLSKFPEELNRARFHKVHRVSGVGFGCTLIQRPVLEEIKFRPADPKQGGHPSPDVPFAVDCIAKGYEAWAHFEVICGHINADGEILWPRFYGKDDPNMPGKEKRFIALANVNAQVGSKLYKFNAGDEYDFEPYEVTDLVRAGYLRPKATTRRKRTVKKDN